MSGDLVIHGMPNSIRRDGWWLSSSKSENTADAGGDIALPECVTDFPKRRPGALGLLLFLVLLADWLFWEHDRGLSVALFAMALSVAILAMKPGGVRPRQWAMALGFEVLCNLPLIEVLHAMSILFSLSGLVVLAIWVTYDRLLTWWQSLWIAARIATIGVAMLPIFAANEVKGMRAERNMAQRARALVLPMGVGLVFVALLSAANPVLEQYLEQLSRLKFLCAEHIDRGVFWAVLACALWPFLTLDKSWLGSAAAPKKTPRPNAKAKLGLINEESVRTSLVLFNALFLVQTAMDLGVLTGGLALPEGMTYARYAHQGAYPLVATALLAGLFAIATYRMVGRNRLLRVLMLLWIGQNMVLVITAAVRLNLYIEAYSLTNLRVAAFIWMGLVFVALMLTIVQITQGKSLSWLIRSNVIILYGTLYVVCFINFAHVIATYNLQNPNRFGDRDVGYICRMSGQALPAIHAFEAQSGEAFCAEVWRGYPQFEPIENWRDWGFRQWRLQRYLAERSEG